MINSWEMQFFFINSNFDGKALDKPITQYIDKSYSDGFNKDLFKKRDIILTPNEAILSDDQFYTQRD
jgi:hypothetical protein